MVGARASLAAALLAFAAGGCSFQLGSMSDQHGDHPRAQHTASIATVAPSKQPPAEADGSLRAAASELLARNEPNASLPWQNPKTGARGTVSAVADAYTQAGLTCRDFLASYIHGESEDWLQGEACRERQGHWEVRRLKPWSRS